MLIVVMAAHADPMTSAKGVSKFQPEDLGTFRTQGNLKGLLPGFSSGEFYSIQFQIIVIGAQDSKSLDIVTHGKWDHLLHQATSRNALRLLHLDIPCRKVNVVHRG